MSLRRMWLFSSYPSHKLIAKYGKLKPGQYGTLADKQLAQIQSLYDTVKSRLKAKVIFYNYPEIDDYVFGNFANKIHSSFLYQQRKLNYLLMEYAANTADLYICDLSSIQNQAGKAGVFQPSIYINTEMVLSIDVLPEVAAKTLDIIAAMNGKFKKCLILDLDNTTWGGIIGDDGLENIQIGALA
ncbi:MAG: hypothetical protein EOP47_30460 [Sphingobacteriaceae bacterium]|nr:MAG: hypothetical protein EOP47_30460 [Sphingobacteriaceae bacterium]